MDIDVVRYYENYREEDRLTTNNARKIEFLTTTKRFDSILDEGSDILDCAAGTGAYAFYLADKGHHVTATDITPRHIAYIDEKLKEKAYSMDTMVLDAADLSCFSDEQFDSVLNMGPFYHITDEAKRTRCLEESLRVLKKGGLIAVAYIPRFYINQMLAVSDGKYLNAELLEQIRNTGVLMHDDPNCFWTDTYYSSYDEMQDIFKKFDLEIVDHFAQDGLAPLLCQSVDKWSEEQVGTWLDYYLKICSQRSLIDMSNHVLIVGRKR